MAMRPARQQVEMPLSEVLAYHLHFGSRQGDGFVPEAWPQQKAPGCRCWEGRPPGAALRSLRASKLGGTGWSSETLRLTVGSNKMLT